MANRRDFIKTATLVLAGGTALAGCKPKFNITHTGEKPRLKMRFFPYELQLQHTFTVATYSRTTTPDVQVELEYHDKDQGNRPVHKL